MKKLLITLLFSLTYIVANAQCTGAPIKAGAASFCTVNGVVISGSATPTLSVTGTATISGTHSGTSSGTNTGDQTSVSGSAGSAPAGTLTGSTLNSSVTASSLVSFGTSPSLVAPLLGTPTSGILTNCTGTAAGLTAGNVTTNANLNGDVVSVGNAATVVKVNGTLLSGLATGILKNTTGTGVPSIAIAADFPTLNQNTSGNAATVTTNANLNGPIASVGNTTSITSQTGNTTTFVMQDSPTITTQAIIPTVYGSSSSGGNLQLTSTSNATKGFTYIGTGIGIDETNIRLGIGTQAPTVPLHLISQTSTSNANNIFTDFYETSVSNPGFQFRKARGSLASPTDALSGDGLGLIGARGYVTGTGFTTSPQAAIQFTAAENYTGTSNTGSNIFFTATPVGGSSRNTIMMLSGNSLVAIGGTVPAAVLDINGASGALSANAWTTSGVLFRLRAFSITDATSSGTVANVYMNTFGATTLLASSSTTYTNAVGTYFDVPTANTNVTIGSAYAIGLNGNILFTTGNKTISAVSSLTTSVGSSNDYTVQQGGSNRFKVTATTGNTVFTNAASSSGTTAMTTWTQSVNTGGSAGLFTVTAGAHTGQTTATEVTDINFNLSAAMTLVDGTVPNMRAARIQGRTYNKTTTSATLTKVSTLSVDGPTMGAGVTGTTQAAIECNGNFLLPTVGNKIFIKEGSGGFMGQTTLVAGTKAVTVSGVTTSTRCFLQLVSAANVALTVECQCACTANTVTLQANVAAGTINVNDTSVYNYILYEPAP